MRRSWDAQSEQWIRWARAPGHDSFWTFHGDRFFELVPAPGRLTLDVGAGEGRVTRELRRRGHRVVAVDGSPLLARACATHDEPAPTAVADAAHLPVRARVADLAIAFMSLQDVDDLEEAVAELGRVVAPGGHLCAAIVHPVSSAGRFEDESDGTNRPFVIRGSYFERFRYDDDIERDGLRMVFTSEHRPLDVYSRALEHAGFAIDALHEVTEPDPDDVWHRVPMFLDLRAVRRRRAPGARSRPSAGRAAQRPPDTGSRGEGAVSGVLVDPSESADECRTPVFG